jgi:hypothetical protein
MRKPFAFAFLLFLTATLLPAEKQRDWQTGTLRDSSRSRYFAGSVGHANTNGNIGDSTYTGNTNSSETAIYRVYQNYEIEGDQYVYLAQEHIKWRWSKSADVAVNEKVKYAVEKRTLIVIDDEGKEHKMEIVKRVLKTQEQPR